MPYLIEYDIAEKKLGRRYNKVVRRLSERIELNFPVVLTNMNKIVELHGMRKDCKKLRHQSELMPDQNNKTHEISEVEDIQHMLGSMHDSDTMIACLKRVRRSKEITHILDNEITERNTKYQEFIQFCKSNLSSS